MLMGRPLLRTRPGVLQRSCVEVLSCCRRRELDVGPRHALTRWSYNATFRRDEHSIVSARYGGHELDETLQGRLKRFERLRCEAGTSSTNWNDILRTDAATLPQVGSPVRLHGYLTGRREGKSCWFAQLVDPRLEHTVQVILPKHLFAIHEDSKEATPATEHHHLLEKSKRNGGPSLINGVSASLEQIRPHSAVQVSGNLVQRPVPHKRKNDAKKAKVDSAAPNKDSSSPTSQSLDPFVGEVDLLTEVELHVDGIVPLGSLSIGRPPTTDDTVPPTLRPLQIKTDSKLRERLRLRSQIMGKVRAHMLGKAFDEVETPLLFKSTPEGAREYIVPTRKKGMAYALPQSPQQYKQVLMASGIPKYFQFAKCFRDEDLRADRQPEFTQLDLEMAFANSFDVMSTVEDVLLNAVWPSLSGKEGLSSQSEIAINATPKTVPETHNQQLKFPIMTYQDTMNRYGSDKPDVRFGAEIRRVEDWLPQNVRSMVSHVDDPVAEMFKVNMQGAEPAESLELIKVFSEASSLASYASDPARSPGWAVYDPLKPLRGFAIFGHEAAFRIEEEFEPEPGDIFAFWTRADGPFSGGSTVIGDLRRDLHQMAVARGLIPAPSGFAALWITDFPLFSPIQEGEPGQGGVAGLCSTHHPFTAPKQGFVLEDGQDLLSIPGDHYDLVINGVEVGGGSCRIHQESLQRYVLENILKIGPERLSNFDHLLKALQCGCPPHAGFALGFDRLMAMITGMPSVRDVIAFPKYADGEDIFVGAPSQLTPEQLATYHLAIADKVSAMETAQVSQKA